MIRGPTSASTINSTVPLDSLYAWFQPRYRTRSSIAGNTCDRPRYLCSGQIFGVLLNLAQAGGDLLNIFFIPQQGWLWNPDRLPGRFLSLRKAPLQERMTLFRLLSAQPLSILAIAKHVQLVERRIARLIGDAFRVHRCDEAIGGDPGKVLFIHVKDVGILTVTRAAVV